MVAHDRERLHDYALALARTLAAESGVRVEAYHPDRVEALVVDLMLHRFDAALSDISRPAAGHGTGWPAVGARPGCVLFVAHAESMPRGEFRQLLRVAAGTRRNGLRLVALFDASRAGCDERIADMGTQVARWDLDADDDHHADRDHLHPVHGAATLTRLPRFARQGHGRHGPHIAANGRRWLVAAGIAAVAALLPALAPTLLPHADLDGLPGPWTAAANGTMTYAVQDKLIGTAAKAAPNAAAEPVAKLAADMASDVAINVETDVPAVPAPAPGTLPPSVQEASR